MILPRDGAFDSTFALLYKEGYEYISSRCQRFGVDAFATRIMLRKAICIRGADAAALFYKPGRFTRQNALPLFALALIQDVGSVMVMDGEDHRRRKQMFLSLMSREELMRLADLTAEHWRRHIHTWQGKGSIDLFKEAHTPLCAAICEWAGLRLSDKEIHQRANEFLAMVEGAGSPGPRNWRGHLLRVRSERWMRSVVHRIRRGKEDVPKGSAAEVISNFCDRNGKLLDVKAAAVELINVLRPTVANARYILFAAVALEAHPDWKARLKHSDEYIYSYVDEVRRFYPFIPFIGGRVLEPFEWRGHVFTSGQWVLFDIYGTNHDVKIWGDPHVFRPERFEEQRFGPFDLVSHGAGDRRLTHRCPGERITIEQMKVIVCILVREITYELPQNDLGIDLTRIPAIPKKRFLIRNVQLTEKQPC